MGTLYCQQAPSFGWDVKPRSWLSVIIKNPRMSFEKSRGVTSASWPNSPIGLWPSWPPNHPHICWLASPISWCVVDVLAHIWLPSHHPSGCCILVVDEEIPPSQCKALWEPRKALYKCNELLTKTNRFSAFSILLIQWILRFIYLFQTQGFYLNGLVHSKM